tara:strand:- start:2323 stop:3027 length:705 start_codon:yes stop_codon:yes gene_type:complete
MPNYIIGKENLPNVYIDSIIIENDGYNLVSQVELSMYDFPEPEDSTWKFNHDMDDLKVLIVTTNDINIINDINVNGSSLLKYNQMDYVSYDIIDKSLFESVFIGQPNIGPSSNQAQRFVNVLQLNNVDFENLNIYACTMVELNMFDNPQLDKYCGAVTGEIIFLGGETPSESGYFYYPDTNEEYGGPVHFHNGEYMEDSSHSVNAHKIVRYVPETNAKITVRTPGSPFLEGDEI